MGLKHSREKQHQDVCKNGFKVLDNKYQPNFKRKINEAPFIRQLKPSLTLKRNKFSYSNVIDLLFQLTKIHLRAIDFRPFSGLYCQV